MTFCSGWAGWRRWTSTQTTFATPSKFATIPGVRDFVARLFRAKKSFGEKNFNDWLCFWGQVHSQINNISYFSTVKARKKTEESVQPEFEENQKSPEFRRCCRRHPIEKHAWVIVKNLARPCPPGSVNSIFIFLHEKLGLVKKLAKILQICCPYCRRSAHLVGRRRVSGPKKALFSPDLSSAVYFLLPREKNLL